MVGVTVSPSTVGSPAAGSSSSSSSLFDSVHDHVHHQSDWEDFYESPTGEEEEVYLLIRYGTLHKRRSKPIGSESMS